MTEGSVGVLVKHRSLAQPGLLLAGQLSAGPSPCYKAGCWPEVLLRATVPPISACNPVRSPPPGGGCMDFPLDHELCSNLLHVGQWEVGPSRQEAIGLSWSASHCSHGKHKKQSSEVPTLKAWNSSCLKPSRGWHEGIHCTDPMIYLDLTEKGEKAEINSNLYCFYLDAGLTEHFHVVAFLVWIHAHLLRDYRNSMFWVLNLN